MEEEGKVYVTSRIAFVGNYIMVGLLGVLLLLLFVQFNLTFTLFPQTSQQLVSSLVVLGFLMVMVVLIEEPLWRRIMHHYIVTEKEIIYKSGLIKKKRMSLPYQSIADVKIEKGMIGRIFNFGDIILDGFKEGMTINGIRRPEVLYEELRAKVRPTKSVYKKE